MPAALSLLVLTSGAPPAESQTPAHVESAAAGETIEGLVEALRETERAFAATVRAKDLEAFASFIDDGAVFAAGQPLRGREAILEGWAGLFAPEAPVLAWEPCVVEVEASGRIGFTRGPYWFEGPGGEETGGVEGEGPSVARGTFFSVWERQPDDDWKVILDTGTPPEPGPAIADPCPPGEPPG